MNKMLFGAVALVMLLAACGKDEDATPAPQKGTKYLLSSVSALDSTTYKYNADFKLTNIAVISKVDEFKLFYEAKYNGDVPTQLDKGVTSTELGKFKTYDYDNQGRLLRVRYFSTDVGAFYGYDSVYYDDKGRPAGTYYALVLGDTYSYIARSANTWNEKGNIIRIRQTGWMNGAETKDSAIYTYTYDDRKNYYLNIKNSYILGIGDPAACLSANNIVTYKYVSNSDTDSSNNIYTYDEDGYPATRKTSSVRVIDGVEYKGESLYKLSYIQK